MIKGTKSKRKVVTLSDGRALIDVNLRDGLAETVIHKGTCIEVPCVHLDLYKKKVTELNRRHKDPEKHKHRTILFLSNYFISFISFAYYRFALFYALNFFLIYIFSIVLLVTGVEV